MLISELWRRWQVDFITYMDRARLDFSQFLLCAKLS